MDMKKGLYIKLLLTWFCIGVVFVNTGRTQTYNMSSGTVTTCTGTFYDSGGTGGSATTTNKPGNYADNENKTMTFCSSNAAQSIIITFTAFNVENSFDNLKVYNGPNTGSPLIGTYTGTTSPGTVYSAPGGCVTFNFKSDGSNNYLGWAATISCGTAPNQDCITKKALCGTTSLNDNTNGFGSQEINSSNGGCFYSSSAVETQSSWYQLTMANTGTFNFTITPNNGTDDDDWAIWGPNPACPPASAPLRCTT